MDRRRRWLWLLPLILGLLALDVFVAATRRAGGQAFPDVSLVGAQPWTDTAAPAPPTLRQLPAPPPPLSDAPPCPASTLRVTDSRVNGAGGEMLFSVEIKNIGGTTCSLKGYPTSLQAVSTDGVVRTIPLTDKPAEFANVAVLPTNLAPGASGGEELLSSDECSPADFTRYPQIRLGMPGGGTLRSVVSVTEGGGYEFLCGRSMVTALGVQAPQPQYAPLPLQDITSTVDAPRSVPADSVLTFVATVSNPTAQPIPLSSCGGYREVLDGPSSDAVVETYALNCAGLSVLAPHGSQRFEMKIRTPDVSRTKRAPLVWMADTALDHIVANLKVTYVTIVARR